jgi:hypothetical protein
MVQGVQSVLASTEKMESEIAFLNCVPRPSASWIAPNGWSLRPAAKTSTRDSMHLEARRTALPVFVRAQAPAGCWN